ncbi:MAG: hypothetical protein JKY59_09545 [Emcibacter sp.]|nr:hypothetical protein [Emcibacter sp.]
MHVFEMVALIVAIGVFGKIIMQYIDRKHPKISDDMMDKMKNNSSFGDAYITKKDFSAYMNKFQAMEERLQVLERIATDKGRSLASEIDNLK